mmetsp:Transcript_64788/g.115226  ORF Transcript_64788/g.115226 Transcript_64788/m.115226 type:complete len:315 (-) Transcript_64788:265-1209(-)
MLCHHVGQAHHGDQRVIGGRLWDQGLGVLPLRIPLGPQLDLHMAEEVAVEDVLVNPVGVLVEEVVEALPVRDVHWLPNNPLRAVVMYLDTHEGLFETLAVDLDVLQVDLVLYLSAHQLLRCVDKRVCQLGLEGWLPAKAVAWDHLHSQRPLDNAQQGPQLNLGLKVDHVCQGPQHDGSLAQQHPLLGEEYGWDRWQVAICQGSPKSVELGLRDRGQASALRELLRLPQYPTVHPHAGLGGPESPPQVQHGSQTCQELLQPPSVRAAVLVVGHTECPRLQGLFVDLQPIDHPQVQVTGGGVGGLNQRDRLLQGQA